MLSIREHARQGHNNQRNKNNGAENCVRARCDSPGKKELSWFRDPRNPPTLKSA